ncbi:fimbrial protein [Pseudomonas sp. NPDC087803]|uniref:fimbrial protein n=1 Tax=Pseudomonas sp. NPDC087803 TaxID=3364448 RepID=UPI00382CA8BA
MKYLIKQCCKNAVGKCCARSIRLKFLSKLFRAMLVLMFSSSAYAICGMMPNYQEGATIDMAMGRISVPATAAVGEVFYTQEFPITGSYFAILSCTPGDTTQWRVVKGTATSIENVYSTNIAGVGIRTSWYQAGAAIPFYAGQSTTWQLGMPGVSGSVQQNSLAVNVSGRVVVELIKTSTDVGSGALAGGIYTNNTAYGTYPFNSGVFLTTRISGGGGEIVPETGTCSIGDLLVEMGAVPISRFQGLGTTSGETPFNVAFTCSGSNGAVTLNLDADRFIANGSAGLIKPQTGSGNAECIALQIIDSDTGQPITLGVRRVVGSVLNGSASFNLPYQVRYYQSDAGKNCVSPGKVHGAATVTVSYQ